MSCYTPRDYKRVADALHEEGPLTPLLGAAAVKVRAGRVDDLTPAELRAARRRLTRVFDRRVWEAERDGKQDSHRRERIRCALMVGEARPSIVLWAWGNSGMRRLDDLVPIDAHGKRYR